jgi:predicted P-loop ATPase
MNRKEIKGFPKNPEKPAMLGFETFSEVVETAFKYSGIHPDLIPDKFQSETRSEYGDHELTGLKSELGWTEPDNEIKNRWSKDIVAYWFENEDGTKWQAIVNIPEIKDGTVKRDYSYIAPKGIGDSVFFPDIPYTIRKLISQRFNIPIGGDPAESIPLESSFWTWWSEFGYALMPLVITEGGKKALSLLSQGIPAIALYGCSCGVIEITKTKKKGVEETSLEIKEVLKPFCKPFGRVLVALDNDCNAKSSTYRKTEIAKNRLMVAFKNEGCKVSKMQWSGDYKGVDDLIVGDSEHFEERLELALYPQELSTNTGMRETLMTRFGSQIQFNSMSQKIEINGTRLTLNQPKTAWNTVLGLPGNYAASDIVDAISGYALEQSYHPVQRYLEVLEGDNSVEPYPLDAIAPNFLDTSDDFSALLIRKWLISAVARVFEPGCQVDTILIFQGEMGLQKSKFFRSLVKDPSWFSSGVSSSKASEKDQKITLHAGWIHDLGEVGSIYKKKEIQELRQFITSTHDEFRPPYARESEVFARRFVFCGTANENDFMADTYGSRRWWVIPVTNKIVIPSGTEVDAMWKAAMLAYRQGEQWWLTDLEDALNSRKNLDFYGDDPWTSTVISVLRENGNQASMETILNGMKLETTQRTRKETDRIAAILRLNGYDNSGRDKDRNRVWRLKGIAQTSGRCGITSGTPQTLAETEFQEKKSQLPDVSNKSVEIQYKLPENVARETILSNATQNNCSGVTEETKNGKSHQVYTFSPDTSGTGGKDGSNPVIEPASDVPDVLPDVIPHLPEMGVVESQKNGPLGPSGQNDVLSKAKVTWTDNWKQCPPARFYQNGKKCVGKLIGPNQIIYAEYAGLYATWFRVKVSKWESA